MILSKFSFEYPCPSATLSSSVCLVVCRFSCRTYIDFWDFDKRWRHVAPPDIHGGRFTKLVATGPRADRLGPGRTQKVELRQLCSCPLRRSSIQRVHSTGYAAWPVFRSHASAVESLVALEFLNPRERFADCGEAKRQADARTLHFDPSKYVAEFVREYRSKYELGCRIEYRYHTTVQLGLLKGFGTSHPAAVKLESQNERTGIH